MVFRVEVIQRGSDRPTNVYVAADSADEAMAIAERGGRFDATRAEPVDAASVPQGEPLLRAPTPPGSRSEARFFDLDARPVVTIAAGVFVGLLSWTLFVFLFAALSGLLSGR